MRQVFLKTQFGLVLKIKNKYHLFNKKRWKIIEKAEFTFKFYWFGKNLKIILVG